MAATCEKTGLTEGKHCFKCGDVIVAQTEVAAKGHSCGEWTETIAPTCTTNGEKRKDCNNCNHYETNTIDALGHDKISHEAKAPTCTDIGWDAYETCSRCEYTTYVEKAALNHNLIDVAGQAADCLNPGYTTYKDCSRCDYIEGKETVDALGHRYTSTVTYPTATEDGFTTYNCFVCGYSYTKAIIPVEFTVTFNNRSQIGYTGKTGENLLIPAVFQNKGIWYRVTKIDREAFYNCKFLNSIEIPDSVISIGTQAFYNCESLTSIKIGNSVTSIGEQAFCDCTSLRRIEIPKSLTNISNSAFAGCTSHKDVYYTGDIEDWLGITFDKAGSNPMCHGANLYFNNELVTEIEISDSITSIDEIAFFNCTSLTKIKVSGSVTSIGEGAFRYCTSLTSVEIGNSVKNIGEGAFGGCSSLESITLPFVGGSASETSASPSTLFGYIFGTSSYTGGKLTKQSYSISYYCTYYIPTSLKSVKISGGTLYYGAFANCSGLISIQLGENVRKIGDHAFSSCKSLRRIEVPYSVRSIGDYAFSGCTSLTSIDTGDSGIGDYVFYGCTSLTSIDIGNYSSIGNYAFYGCTSLTSINFEGTVERWNAIKKDNYWDSYWDSDIGSYTIYCTDGEIAKDGTATYY